MAIERLRSEGGIDGRTARGIASQILKASGERYLRMEQALAERDKTIAERDKAIAEKDATIASQQVTMDAKDSPHCKKERKEPILRIPETGRVLRGTLTEKRHSTYCITLPSILAVRCNEAWPE